MQRTWVGGGNNSASNPKDWSPAGVPQPGDTLIATSAAPMHVSGNALAGDNVTVATSQTATIDMANGSSLNLNTSDVQPYTLTSLNLNVSGVVNLNAIIENCDINTHGGTIHFIGSNTFGPLFGGTINSNIYGPATLLMTGGEGAGSVLTLGGDVGRQVTVEFDTTQPCAELTIVHPNRFFGLIDIANNSPPPPYGFGDVLLSGLHATSARLSGQDLRLYNGRAQVGDIRITGAISGLNLSQDQGGILLTQGPVVGDTPILLTHA